MGEGAQQGHARQGQARRERRAGGRLLGLAVLGLALSGAGAGGQGLVFDISTGIERDSNLTLDPADPGPTTRSDTTLGFTLLSETPVQQLALRGEGVLRLIDGPGGSAAGFEDPSLRLSYGTETRDSTLDLVARWRRTDLAFSDPFTVLEPDALPESGDLVLRPEGTLIATGGELRYVTGREGPFGADLALRYDARDYRGTSDPDLYDRRSAALSAALRAELAPGTDGRLSFGYEIERNDDAAETERRTARVSAGVSQRFDAANVVDLSLGYTRVTTEAGLGAGRGTTTEAGLTGAVALTRDLPRGSATASVALDRNANGARTELRFGRVMELRRGSLSADLGYSFGNGGGAFVGSLAYAEEFRTGLLRADLTRSVSVNDDDADIVSTRFGLGYDHEIDRVSRLGLSMDLAMIEGAGSGAVEDQTRATVTASYSRDLTEDWALTGGYRYRYGEDGGGSAASSGVFLTLSRSFEFRR